MSIQELTLQCKLESNDTLVAFVDEEYGPCIECPHDTIALSIPNAIKLRDWLSEVINNATV